MLYAEKLRAPLPNDPPARRARWAPSTSRQHQDKRYSAVDRLSFVVMLQHGIHEVLAFDRRDFSHRFAVLPKVE